MHETARQFLTRRRLERGDERPSVHIRAIHPTIEVALFAINPITKRHFLADGTRHLVSLAPAVTHPQPAGADFTPS